MLFEGGYCYKWQAVYSEALLHSGTISTRLCTARQLRPYPIESENYVNYIATMQKIGATDETSPIVPSAVNEIVREFNPT